MPFHDGNPPFRISSAFPFQQPTKGDVTYYLPRPLVDPPRFYDLRSGRTAKKNYGKLIRDTPFVDTNTFKTYWLSETTRTRIRRTALETANQEIASFCPQTVRPQHARDGLTDATAIYHTGLVYFSPSSGLYFLIELNDMSILCWDELRAVLGLAGTNGLGGRRTHGNGALRSGMIGLNH